MVPQAIPEHLMGTGVLNVQRNLSQAAGNLDFATVNLGGILFVQAEILLLMH